MNDHELIAKARRHLEDIIDRHALAFKTNYGLEADMFTKATVSQRPVVSFSCEDREDVMEIYLDPQSGDLIDGIHIPKQPKSKES